MRPSNCMLASLLVFLTPRALATLPIYTSLASYPCVRLLNATTAIGCQTKRPVSGVLYTVANKEDLTNFLQPDRIAEKYAVVMPYSLLTIDNLNDMRATGKLAGVIAIVNGSSTSSILDRPASFSPDSTCPNCEFGLYANDSNQYQWNPNGTGVIYESFDFPIYALNPIDSSSVTTYDAIAQALEYNSDQSYSYPLQAAEFNEFMWAAVDAETCLRREWCQPVGGFSVYSTPSTHMDSNDGKPIVVVSAALDSKSFFHDLTMGIENSISSVVGLMAVADALSKSPAALESFPKHILYTFFAAEAWAFTGSDRFVQDIKNFQCQNTSNSCPYGSSACSFPCVRDLDFTRINFDKIDSLWHLDAIAQSSSSLGHDNKAFYLHVDDSRLSSPLTQAIESVIANSSTPFSMLAANSDGVERGLPPSSVMSFLKVNRQIPAVVVSDYQSSLSNYYNSDYDDTFDLSAASSAICFAANATARAVWLQAQGLPSSGPSAVPDSVVANCTLVQILLECMATNFSCSYTQNFLNVSNIGRISHYFPVYSFQPNNRLLPLFVFNFMANLTASGRTDKCGSIRDCAAGSLCVTGQCIVSFTRYHDAYGTGLQFGEDGKWRVIDKTRGTWVESTWNPIGFRAFNVISYTSQVTELIVGIIWTVLSVGAVIFAKRYLKKTLKVA